MSEKYPHPNEARDIVSKLDPSQVADLEVAWDYWHNYHHSIAREYKGHVDYSQNNLIKYSAFSILKEGNRLSLTPESEAFYSSKYSEMDLGVIVDWHWYFVEWKKSAEFLPNRVSLEVEIAKRLGDDYVVEMRKAITFQGESNDIDIYAEDDLDRFLKLKAQLFEFLQSNNQHAFMIAAFIYGVNSYVDAFKLSADEVFQYCVEHDASRPGLVQSYAAGDWSLFDEQNLQKFGVSPWRERDDLEGIWIECLKRSPKHSFDLHTPLWFMVHESYGFDLDFVMRLIDEGLEEVALLTAQENWLPKMIPAVRRLAKLDTKTGLKAAASLEHFWPSYVDASLLK